MSEELVVPGELRSLARIGQFVMVAAERAGLDQRKSYRLRMAVDEVATNSITYGYQQNGLSGNLVVRTSLDDRALCVTLEDSGPAFDPRQKESGAETTLGLPLEERPVGGLGVFLALKGVDEFRYEYRDDRNRNIFVVNRPNANART
jgi:serine/threonine-protein kinase RsbW